MNTANPPRPTLVVIPASHYSEKARWALDRLQVPFVEEGHLPLLHYTATLPRGGRTVPVLVTPHQTLTDSTDILRHLDASAPPELSLYPDDPEVRREVETLEDQFGARLGSDTRRVAYAHLLPHRELCLRIMIQRTPVWERLIIEHGYGVFAGLMTRALRLSPSSTARCLDRITTTFDEVAELLQDGRPFLTGAQFTAADLTFAALSAPVLLPPLYGAWMPSPDELPSDYRALAEELRAHPAGAFALRMYAEHRSVG